MTDQPQIVVERHDVQPGDLVLLTSKQPLTADMADVVMQHFHGLPAGVRAVVIDGVTFDVEVMRPPPGNPSRAAVYVCENVRCDQRGLRRTVYPKQVGKGLYEALGTVVCGCGHHARLQP